VSALSHTKPVGTSLASGYTTLMRFSLSVSTEGFNHFLKLVLR